MTAWSYVEFFLLWGGWFALGVMYAIDTWKLMEPVAEPTQAAGAAQRAQQEG